MCTLLSVVLLFCHRVKFHNYFVSCTLEFNNMCTVTFIPKANGDFVFMSSRDEATSRLTTKPDFYSLKGVKCLFPKDSIAGGTWIGLSEHSRLVCLLNGGYTKHKRQLNYKHSRGKVVRYVLVATDYKGLLYTYDFIDIEPFTLLVDDIFIKL